MGNLMDILHIKVSESLNSHNINNPDIHDG
jgi:hypothetical protein